MLKFIMRLALHMGRPDFGKMVQEISQTDLEWWIAYDSVEPFGNPWRRMARQTVILANVQGAKLTHEHEEQLIPGYDPTDLKQTPEQMAAILKGLNIDVGNK